MAAARWILEQPGYPLPQAAWAGPEQLGTWHLDLDATVDGNPGDTSAGADSEKPVDSERGFITSKLLCLISIIDVTTSQM